MSFAHTIDTQIGVHIGTRALLVIKLTLSLTYPIWEEGSLLLVHLKTTCLRGANRKGGLAHPVVDRGRA